MFQEDIEINAIMNYVKRVKLNRWRVSYIKSIIEYRIPMFVHMVFQVYKINIQYLCKQNKCVDFLKNVYDVY